MALESPYIYMYMSLETSQIPRQRLGRYAVRLCPLLAQADHFDMHAARQSRQRVFPALPARLIFVKHQRDFSLRTDGGHEERFLLDRQRAAHERHDIRNASLMQSHAVKESLDHDQPLILRMVLGPVQVIDHQRLMESRRQFVLALAVWRITRPAAGVGHELALLVMNRDGDPPGHDAFADAISHPKVRDRLWRKPPLGQVRMRRVQGFERELQGW